jgi:hypothetical protein
MPINSERLRFAGGVRAAHRSSSDIQSLRRALRRTLAEIDFAFESDVEVVKNSATDESLKRMVIATLQQHHISGSGRSTPSHPTQSCPASDGGRSHEASQPPYLSDLNSCLRLD